MGYSPWGCKESDPTEQLTLGLPVRTFGYHKTTRVIGKQDSEPIKGWHYSRHLGQSCDENKLPPGRAHLKDRQRKHRCVCVCVCVPQVMGTMKKKVKPERAGVLFRQMGQRSWGHGKPPSELRLEGRGMSHTSTWAGL